MSNGLKRIHKTISILNFKTSASISLIFSLVFAHEKYLQINCFFCELKINKLIHILNFENNISFK
jgi:hypothetical protein